MNSKVSQNYQALKKEAEKVWAKLDCEHCVQIQIGSATCENAAGAGTVYEEFRKNVESSKRSNIYLKQVGCTGRCSREPIVTVMVPNQKPVIYQKVDAAKAHEIFVSHVLEGKPVKAYQLNTEEEKGSEKTAVQEKLSEWEMTQPFFCLYGNVSFYCYQSRVALKNIGLIEPLNIHEYIHRNGFRALAKVLEKNDPAWVVEEIKASHLRGRGGAGFPTWKKWDVARSNAEKVRYMICNADEGDPGAFKDRSVLESDPYSLIEGMIIAGFAIGAEKGFIYVRAEYPLAVQRVEKALAICRENKLLGQAILGSDFNFDIELRLGAGAFVCGEETALIHSIEGERGQPRIRPPFPAQKGLWGKPTVINNVETLTNVPMVIEMGGKEFSQIGTPTSGGTKVFALTGKINHTGLVEVPMGTPLKEIIYSVGGGIPNNKKLKAVQTGGPAGGFIPASMVDTPVDYDTLAKIGSIVGSGGMIVLDEDNCMVDVAKFYVTFMKDESCGKCTPCREGTKRLLEILERITQGKGSLTDLDRLERLAHLLRRASLCGLGKAAPNPILSSLKYFRDEYIAHVVEKRCPAGKCKALLHYEIDPKKCVGCTLCAKNCPVQCISGVRQQVHVIDQLRCIKCGRCFESCRFDAVKRI